MIVSGGNVCCEWLMKKDEESTLFWQNFQLYLFGILFNVTMLLVQVVSGGTEPMAGGVFHGFTGVTVLIV